MLGLTNKLYEFSLSQIKQVTPFSKKCLYRFAIEFLCPCGKKCLEIWWLVTGTITYVVNFHIT